MLFRSSELFRYLQILFHCASSAKKPFSPYPRQTYLLTSSLRVRIDRARRFIIFGDFNADFHEAFPPPSFPLDAVIIHENEPSVFVFSVSRKNRRVKRETGVMKIVSRVHDDLRQIEADRLSIARRRLAAAPTGEKRR